MKKSKANKKNQKKQKTIKSNLPFLSRFVILLLVIHLLMAILSAADTKLQETISKIHGYSRVIAAVGFFFIIFYSAYKYYFSESEIERKEAWTTLGYGVVGAILVLMAPAIGEYLAGNKALFSSDPKCTI